MQGNLYHNPGKPGIFARKPAWRAFTFAVLALFLVGCSTGTQRDGGVKDRLLESLSGEPVIPRTANTIFVRDFENGTVPVSIAGRLAMRVRELISSDGRLGVVDDESAADLMLLGRMVSYEVQALRYDAMGTVIEKRMRSVVRLTLADIKRGRDVFTNETVQSFVVFSDRVPPVESEPVVQDRLLEEMAKRIVAQTITGWYTKYMTSAEKGKR